MREQKSFIGDPENSENEIVRHLENPDQEIPELEGGVEGDHPDIERTYNGESIVLNPYSSGKTLNLDQLPDSVYYFEEVEFEAHGERQAGEVAVSKEDETYIHQNLYSALKKPETEETERRELPDEGDIAEFIENNAVLFSTEGDAEQMAEAARAVKNADIKVKTNVDSASGPVIEAKYVEDRVIVGPTGPDVELEQDYEVTEGDGTTIEMLPSYCMADNAKYGANLPALFNRFNEFGS